jgi:predicted CXXCH cytochrome family protein
LVTVTSEDEGDFVLSLIDDEKYWFQWDETHNYVMNGPFLGGYQPAGSDEPDSNWQWVSGEPFEYTNWAYDGMAGDEDPRPNDQPNDATGNQNVIALGEVNIPVSTWGDFPHRLSSYNDPHEGGVYAFIIECEDSSATSQTDTGSTDTEDSITFAGADFIGSEACSACHEDLYNVFMQSGHPYVLNAVVDGQPPEYPFTEVLDVPEGYTWDDISYIIGGYNWKARFIDKEGYIITGIPGTRGDGNTDYVNQFNFPNPVVGNDAGWVGWHPGEERVYDCGVCHTTGYNPEGHQNDMPGMIGTWTEDGVFCEECHGPGSQHASDPYGVILDIERSSALCGECHQRGGFIKKHAEQTEELFLSKHITVDCVICHDPHAGVIQLRKAEVQTTRTLCENCHFNE